MSQISHLFKVATSISVCLIMSSLFGCATPMKIPKDGPTTLEIYRDHIGDVPTQAVDQGVITSSVTDISQQCEQTFKRGKRQVCVQKAGLNKDSDVQLITVSREIIERQSQYKSYSRLGLDGEINDKFPSIPNPEYTMFVYPHITQRGGLPIPFYATKWKLFEKEHFAKPGEVPIKR